MGATARNVGIILLIAVAVYALPGGGSSADLIAALLSAAITVSFTLIGIRLYRENRMTIFGLGAFVWFALIGAAAYALVLVWRAWRAY